MPDPVRRQLYDNEILRRWGYDFRLYLPTELAARLTVQELNEATTWIQKVEARIRAEMAKNIRIHNDN